MAARERLYQLVDELEPDAVERLIARWNEVLFLSSDWEPDDRPPTPAEEAALDEARADIAAGDTVSLAELEHRHPPTDRR